MSMQRPQVSVVAMSTGRYHEFVPALVAGAREHILGLDRIFILSDAQPPPDNQISWLPFGHLPWPYPTLLRYRAMSAYRDVLREASVLLYLDIDMRIQRDIDLGQLEGTLAVQHPGFVGIHPDELPYERRRESTSCIPLGEGTAYFAGGIQGGRAPAYLEACTTIAAWVQADLTNGIVPRWHDESAWNRYCTTRVPELVLPPTYCSPEYHDNADAYIVALDKDHDRLRETPLSARIARGWQRSYASSRRAARRLVGRSGRSR